MLALDIDFGTIFLLHFRIPDPMKIGPQRCPNAIRKKIQKDIAFGSFGIDFASILGPNLDPGRGVRERRFGRFLRSWCGLGGKMAPGCPKSASRNDFEAILVGFQWMFGALAAVSSCVKTRAER